MGLSERTWAFRLHSLVTMFIPISLILLHISFEELGSGEERYPLLDLDLLANTLALPCTVGPERPHTYNNPEWEAATREYLLRQQSNPIEGISSKQKS